MVMDGSVAVDMAECRLDFQPMHHGQRNRQVLRGGHFRALAIFEVILPLTFPSLRSGARCASMAVFNL